MEKNYTVIDGELVHWGVPGMRWGVRRYQNKDGSLTSAGKKRYNSEMAKLRADKKVVKTASATKAKLEKLNEERKAASEQKKALFGKKKEKSVDDETKSDETPDARKLMKKKKASKMTDEELKMVIARMELEKNYKDLIEEVDKKTKRHKNAMGIIEDSIIASGKNIVTQILNQAGSKAVNKAIETYAPFLGDKDDKGNFTPVIFANNKKK